MYKKAWCTCKVVVLLIKPIAFFFDVLVTVRVDKQQRRRRLRKRHLKSEFALPQTLSRLFHLVQFVKCWQFFSGVEF